MASANSMTEAGHPKLVLWDNPERRRGEGGARGDTCIPVADSCWHMAKTITILWSNYPPIRIINWEKKISHAKWYGQKKRKFHSSYGSENWKGLVWAALKSFLQLQSVICGLELRELSGITLIYLFVLHGLWYLSSSTRDWTWVHGSESRES